MKGTSPPDLSSPKYTLPEWLGNKSLSNMAASLFQIHVKRRKRVCTDSIVKLKSGH